MKIGWDALARRVNWSPVDPRLAYKPCRDDGMDRNLQFLKAASVTVA